MKYTITVNQAGIVDAGFGGGWTDLIDWAIIDYVNGWQSNPKAIRRDGGVWINYRHLMEAMPLLGLNSKQAVSRRVAKLADLGLLDIERAPDRRVFARLSERCHDTINFRAGGGSPTPPAGVNGGGQQSTTVDGVSTTVDGGVNHGGHSLDNQISKTNKKTPPPPTRVRARPAATEDPEHTEPADPDAQPPDQHPPWLRRDLEQRSERIAAARAELGSGLAAGAAFAMHADWRPGPSFADRCAMAGVGSDYTDEQIGEFISYWSGEGSVARQGQWEHRFLTRLRRTAADSASTGDPHAPRRSTRAADIDPYDDSWLTEDTIAYVESGREIGERLRAGQPVVRRDDDGVYRLATGDDR